MRKEYLEAGRIRSAHGLRGEVKAENWLDNDEAFAAVPSFFLGPAGERELKVASRRRQGELFLLSFEGITDPETARLLRCRTLYARRKDLDPEGKKVFYAELFGLPMREAGSGKIYGKIADVTDRGAGDLYVIDLPDGRQAYFPAVKEWIRSMDPETGVEVTAPEGIFDP